MIHEDKGSRVEGQLTIVQDNHNLPYQVTTHAQYFQELPTQPMTHGGLLVLMSFSTIIFLLTSF